MVKLSYYTDKNDVAINYLGIEKSAASNKTKITHDRQECSSYILLGMGIFDLKVSRL